jgi:hypothetical protein
VSIRSVAVSIVTRNSVQILSSGLFNSEIRIGGVKKTDGKGKKYHPSENNHPARSATIKILQFRACVWLLIYTVLKRYVTNYPIDDRSTADMSSPRAVGGVASQCRWFNVGISILLAEFKPSSEGNRAVGEVCPVSVSSVLVVRGFIIQCVKTMGHFQNYDDIPSKRDDFQPSKVRYRR